MKQSTKRVIMTGVIDGLLSGTIEIGWGALIPPRTPQHEEEPPPMTLLHKLNLPNNIKHAMYRYSENDIPTTVMGVRYDFSIANVIVYGLLAEKYPEVTTLRGTFFGILVHIAFHEYILPRLNLTPQVKDLPEEERISELLGHIVWMNTIGLIRNSRR